MIGNQVSADDFALWVFALLYGRFSRESVFADEWMTISPVETMTSSRFAIWRKYFFGRKSPREVIFMPSFVSMRRPK